MYFESHAHYDDERFDEDRDELLAALPSHGVDFVLNTAADMESTRFGIGLAERYDYVFAAAGVHPHSAKELNDETFEELKAFAGHPKVVAIGETGLDFHYDYSPRDVQRFWFKKQLGLALAINKPVIIHSREAAMECYENLTEYVGITGVIHCYSGSAEMAMDYVKRGFYIGIGGAVTFPKARKLIEVAEAVPLERILLETDSPYLAPAPYRGKRNDSRLLYLVAEKIAEIKRITAEEAASVTKANALRLFVD